MTSRYKQNLYRATIVLLAQASFTFAPPLLQSDFKHEDWLARFNSFTQPPWTEGLERTTRVLDSAKKHHVLRVTYPAHKFGNDHSGAQWITYLNGKYEKLTLTYEVKFESGFAFVKGGKLPGLIGGHRKDHPHSTLTGGHKPNGKDGWSARIMWRRDGNVVQYVYHPDQPENFGHDFPWRIDGRPARFIPGQWHVVKTEIQMNTPGKKNGVIRSWLDGEPALEVTTLRFRDVAEIGIDAVYFSTFYGGDEPSWAPPMKTHTFFDHFQVDH